MEPNIAFVRVRWERQLDGTWSKIRYKRFLNANTGKYSNWVRDVVFKTGVSQKEYFTRKLNGTI